MDYIEKYQPIRHSLQANVNTRPILETCSIANLNITKSIGFRLSVLLLHSAKASGILFCKLSKLDVGGSGRQSVSRLATYMARYDLNQIEIAKNYRQTERREDLKFIAIILWYSYNNKNNGRRYQCIAHSY